MSGPRVTRWTDEDGRGGLAALERDAEGAISQIAVDKRQVLALIAEVRFLREERDALRVAVRDVGECPYHDIDANDPDCPACQVLMRGDG